MNRSGNSIPPPRQIIRLFLLPLLSIADNVGLHRSTKPLDLWIYEVLRWLLIECKWLFLIILPPALLLLGIGQWSLYHGALAIQTVGMLCTVSGLLQTSRQLSVPGLGAALFSILKAFPPLRHQDVRIIPHGAGSIVGVGSAHVHGMALLPETSLEELVKALEKRQERVDAEIRRLREDLEAQERQSKKQLDEEQRQREAADATLEQRMKEVVVGGIRFELLGIFWILVGVVTLAFL